MTTTKTSVRHLKAHGKYPRFVYRAFTKRSYAEDFAGRGKFRMGNLRVYSTLEDAERRDSSEGEGHFQRFGTVTSVDFVPGSDETFVTEEPGYVHTHTELLPPKFALSCALPGVDLEYLRARFGAWVVRIDDPRRLAQEVSDYLAGLPNRFAAVEGCLVHYNKGGKVRADVSNIALTRLSYSQKPAAFNQEKEFRFVVIAMGTPRSRFNADYLTVELGRALGYVSHLTAGLSGPARRRPLSLDVMRTTGRHWKDEVGSGYGSTS